MEGFTVNGQPSTIQERRIDSKQYSNELQFTYATQYLNAVVGAYYFHERQRPIDSVGFKRRSGLPNTPSILARDGIPLDLAYQLCGYGPGTTTGGSAIVTPEARLHPFQPRHRSLCSVRPGGDRLRPASTKAWPESASSSAAASAAKR